MRSGFRRAFVRRFGGVLFRSDGVEVSDNLCPSLAHALESSIVLWEHKAGVDQPKARAVFDSGKGPCDDRVQPGAVPNVSLVSTFPGIGEGFVWHHLQHLAA